MIVAAVEWSNLTVAGAFVVGILAGAIATIRITRHVLEYLRHERRSSDD